MDSSLMCNNLKCRQELTDRAFITACSHIFCWDCVRQLRLACEVTSGQASCPACGSEIECGWGATLSHLDSKDDNKSAALVGFSPRIALECIERSLSFWTYQKSQELFYQQHLYRALTEKYTKLKSKLSQTIEDANMEIMRLQNMINDITKERDQVCQRNDELKSSHRNKSRQLQQMEDFYQRLRSRSEKGHIQRAASAAVESSLNTRPQQSTMEYGQLNSNHKPRFFGRASLTDGSRRRALFAESTKIDHNGQQSLYNRAVWKPNVELQPKFKTYGV